MKKAYKVTATAKDSRLPSEFLNRFFSESEIPESNLYCDFLKKHIGETHNIERKIIHPVSKEVFKELLKYLQNDYLNLGCLFPESVHPYDLITVIRMYLLSFEISDSLRDFKIKAPIIWPMGTKFEGFINALNDLIIVCAENDLQDSARALKKERRVGFWQDYFIQVLNLFTPDK